MFDLINKFLETLFGDMTKTGITVFAIGLLVTGLLAAFGGEENQGKFKKAFGLCLIGLAAFLLAKAIVAYFQTNLGG
ncbi:TrbC/VirB2 family protein [Paenibacillus kribbensis]|uniref:TrbC/VirB2 family protein n=1 Tax=Paenibacillus kribbensis TaxID=172713 RepID=UPI000838416E|nr:TrbC/VirB2 family protein [Paenibacillus kribbensis]